MSLQTQHPKPSYIKPFSPNHFQQKRVPYSRKLRKMQAKSQAIVSNTYGAITADQQWPLRIVPCWADGRSSLKVNWCRLVYRSTLSQSKLFAIFLIEGFYCAGVVDSQGAHGIVNSVTLKWFWKEAFSILLAVVKKAYVTRLG